MTPSRSRPRPGLATALAVLCAIVLVGGLVMGYWLSTRSQDFDAVDEDRASVVQAAQRFTVTWNTFDPKDAEAYVERVSPLLSAKFRKEFQSTSSDIVSGIDQLGLASDGKVLVDGDGIPLVGVSAMDEDSAEVMVVSDSNRTSNGQKVQRHWRWQLSMVKVGGDWLVDELKAV